MPSLNDLLTTFLNNGGSTAVTETTSIAVPSIVAKTMVASTNQTMLAANSARRFACISNGTAAALFIKFGATASATSHTVSLVAGGYYEVPKVYTGILDAFTTGSGQVMVTEL